MEMADDINRETDIILTPATLASMYGNNLYNIVTNIPENAENIKKNTTVLPEIKQENPAEFKSVVKSDTKGHFNSGHIYGNFKKGLLLLVEYDEYEFLPPAEMEFLEKILGAFKLNFDDIAIVNLKKNFGIYDQLKADLMPVKILYFDIDHARTGLPIHFPQFQVQSWDNCQFLRAPSLEAMNGNQGEYLMLKKRFHTALKNFLNFQR